MNSPQPQKSSGRIFLALAAAGVVILLLAVSINQLELGEGYSLALEDGETVAAPLQVALASGDVWEILLRGLMALCLIALPIYIIQSFFSKQGRQRLLADVILIALVFLLLQTAQDIDEEQVEMTQEDIPLSNFQPFDMEFDAPAGEPIPEIPEEAPPWVNTIVITLVAALVVAIVVTAYILIRRYRKNQPDDNPLDRVADQAEDALRKIRAGGDFNSAILNCYYEMNRIVQEELKISRQRSMTARDFENYLISKGLPGAPLQQLTILFERARYSKEAPNQEQEQKAVDALTDLIDTVHALAPKEDSSARMRSA
ncbi:MAG: DUF4129 domain-containing protein [Anaerolineae bacterium]|jgi:hypothetical protein|nr:DUF4129 domain-containing protein [Anaerolineae bacterium]